MPNHKGLVEIQDSANNPTIVLDGETGDVVAGGSGQDGLLVASDGAGNERVRVDGSTGTVEVLSPSGDPVVLVDGTEGDVVIYRMVGGANREALRFDASSAALTLGAQDCEGDLLIRDQAGRTVLRFDASSSALYVGAEGNEGDIVVRNGNGDYAFQVDGNTGNLWVRRRIGRTLRNVLHFDAVHAALYIGCQGNEGDLIIQDGGGRDVFRFDSNRAALYLGQTGNEGDLIVRDGGGRQVFHFDSSHAALYLGADGNEGDLIIRDGDGRDVFRFDANYALLDVGAAGNEGDIRVRDNDGDVRIHLDGNSGDIKLLGADCAEDFEVDTPDAAEDGTVLVINDDGRLEPSAHAYDRRVAGVISGAGGYRPGLILDRKPGQGANGRSDTAPPGRRPIALTGKVFCWVDAAYGPIGVGDLLTTSDTPGHAMRAADPLRAFGAVIGKALGRLERGRGLVPVLVALQ